MCIASRVPWLIRVKHCFVLTATKLMAAYRGALAVLLGVILCGCATTEEQGIAIQPFVTAPQRLALVQMPMASDAGALKRLFAPEVAQDSLEARPALEGAIENAERRALAEMKDALEHQAGIKTVDNSELSLRTISELQIDDPKIVITRETAERLRAASGADALLRFRITDYGTTPRSWQSRVIVFEVVSTLGIAAIAYAYPATRPIAGIYLIEEGAEETVEGYAGFWALDEVARPVRIEAELTNLDTGTLAWRGSATGFSDIGLSRLVRKVNRAELDAQTSGATHEAIVKIVADVRTAWPQSDRPRQTVPTN